MKNLNFKIVSVLFVVLLFSGSIAEPPPSGWKPALSVTANGGKSLVYANPGDIITFEIKWLNGLESKLTGPKYYKLDGNSVKWTDGHKWTATPGVHCLRYHVRYDHSSGSTYHNTEWVVIVVSGGTDPNAFRHPGLDVTAAELDRIRHNSAIAGHPMESGLASLKSHIHSSNNPDEKDFLSQSSHAKDTSDFADGNAKFGDARVWQRDGDVVNSLALYWAVTGEQKYADKAIEFLNSWATVNKSMRTNYRDHYTYLNTTHFYERFVQAAELLKYYKGKDGKGSGWKADDVKNFDKWFREVYAPLSLAWPGHGHSVWNAQNQNLNVNKARMMAGIYLNDTTLFKDGYNRMFIKKAFYTGHVGDNTEIHGVAGITYVEQAIGTKDSPGEMMEINRGSETKADYGHANMCLGAIHSMLDLVWHQRGYLKYFTYDDVNFPYAKEYNNFDKPYDFYGLKIRDDAKPRFIYNTEWLTRASLSDAGNVDAILAGSSSKGATRTKYNQKVTIKYGNVGSSWMVYNHYKYRTNNSYTLPAKYVEYVDNGGSGGYRDVLLHADLNKDWVSPDTVKDGAVAIIEINNNTAFSNVNTGFVEAVNSFGKLTITVNGAVKAASIKLYAVNGRLIKKIVVTKNTKKKISINNLNRGVYLIRYFNRGLSETRKIVIR